MWLTSTLTAGPANGALLVDSGPLESGVFDVLAFGFSTADVGSMGNPGTPQRLVLEHRNAANTTSLMAQEFLTGVVFGTLMELRIDRNERLRVRMAAAAPGGVSVRASLSFRLTRPSHP